MATLNHDDILKLARLARLELTDQEATDFATEINQILEYVEQLQAVDVDGLQPTSQVNGLTNVSRADEIFDYGYKPADLMSNVPSVMDGMIKTRRMIG